MTMPQGRGLFTPHLSGFVRPERMEMNENVRQRTGWLYT